MKKIILPFTIQPDDKEYQQLAPFIQFAAEALYRRKPAEAFTLQGQVSNDTETRKVEISVKWL